MHDLYRLYNNVAFYYILFLTVGKMAHFYTSDNNVSLANKLTSTAQMSVAKKSRRLAI
jgi:hypothetical protein